MTINPFKLWGSYVGLVLFYIVTIIAFSNPNPGLFNDAIISSTNTAQFTDSAFTGISVSLGVLMFDVVSLETSEFVNSGFIFNGNILLVTMIILIVGFLLGWIIHLIIRGLFGRKKKWLENTTERIKMY